MGKKKAVVAVDPGCEHEPLEVSKAESGSTFWACPCGKYQWVSGPQTKGRLVELKGKERLSIEPLPLAVVEHRKEQEKPAPIPQLSSGTNEHYTPAFVVEAARRLMGGIDLDPASCEEANKIVKAGEIYTQADDGLRFDWDGRVFLNPPGGTIKMGNKGFSSAAVWWSKLVQEWQSGRVHQAIFIGFTLEILRHSQNGCPLPVQRFHRCYPKGRLKFGGLTQPTHANVIVFLPPTTGGHRLNQGIDREWIQHMRRFEQEFKEIGCCEPGWDPTSVDP